MKPILFGILFSLCFKNVYSESEPGQYKFLHSKTYIKNPLELRDPFKRKLVKKKGVSKAKIRASGIFDNSTETIENKSIDSIKIVGVVIGKERRAMAKVGTGAETFIIKEGMKIGPNGAEVRAILPGGIILVEKIQNVYDQEEYLETVLPISND